MDPALPVDIPAQLKNNHTILNATLSQVEIWAPYSSSISHWRTSFKFSEVIPTTRNGYDEYLEGISVDMCLPLMHVYTMDLPADVDNRCGSLKVMVRDKGRLTAHNVVCSSVFPLRQHITVLDLLKLLDSKDLQYYDFHHQGIGCLFWQMTWLRALADRNWIQSDYYDVLGQAVASFKKNWTKSKAAIVWPPVEGKFYRAGDKGKEHSILPMITN
ncbi:hypothetical protein BDN72DRAFT_899975 [Pluteus cervinus]|uniref:Uncharacterized protein n=1 Tax=Pluteus cervinus TaxID=181527 RepID=A0ACD3AKQ5_9AGAR|nr:hypothetical protein BDN72DRAFT_899975 [Pluteus cervinus]